MGDSQLWQNWANQMARGMALGLPVQGQLTGGQLKELPTFLRWSRTRLDPTPSQVGWQRVASAKDCTKLQREYTLLQTTDSFSVEVCSLKAVDTARCT